MRQDQSHITVPESTAILYDAARYILQHRRLVKHSMSDAIVVSLNAVLSASVDQVRLVSRFYVRDQGPVRRLLVQRPLAKKVQALAKRYKVSKAALLYAVGTIFVRAALTVSSQQRDQQYYGLLSILTQVPNPTTNKVLDVPSVKVHRIATEPSTKRQEAMAMRHHNYLEEFRAYMARYGGVSQWLNKNVKVYIHAHPIAGNVNRNTDDEQAIENNPGAEHVVRLWKRGRGYNVTVLGNVESPRGATIDEGAPELPVGSVYRLYEIYRNINWSTITLQESQ